MAGSDDGARTWFTPQGNGASFTETSREGAFVAWSFRIAVLLVILMPGLAGGFTLKLMLVQVGLSAALLVAFLWIARRHFRE